MSKKKKNRAPVQGLLIDAYAAEGKCIGHLEDGKVIFVENVVPGDIVDVLVTKDKSGWAEGRAFNMVTPSPQRLQPFCADFGVCGGCKWQMLSYDRQLAYKQQQVVDQLTRIGNVQIPEIMPILGSAKQTEYRNKLEFTFSTRQYLTNDEIRSLDTKFEPRPGVGFHAAGLFDKVVAIQQCYLQPEPTNKLLHTLRDYTTQLGLQYYDFKAQAGWLRNVIIRVATTGEVLVNIVFQHEQKENREALLRHVDEQVPGITSFNYTINPKVNDTIYDQEVICWKGKEYIEEQLGHLRFRISPKSFFQTNTRQAETLYNVVRDFAGLTGSEILYDLYCGTGSIGLYCAEGAQKVIGIETVADAIVDARQNAAANSIDNCHFFAGDVIKVCTDDFFSQWGKPDVVITDPPRAGMHPALIDQLLKMKPPRIVYVSCNPATQARDLQLLDQAYAIVKLQPVDMFPHTHHIENVALLALR